MAPQLPGAAMIDIQEIASQVANGSVGLWIGSQADPGLTAHSLTISWTAVWSESMDAAFASNLTSAWRGEAALGRRIVIEVPGRRSDALGTLFSFSELCPIFYLAGRQGDPEISPRERRRARDEAVDVLAHLKASFILVTGYSSGSALADLLIEELLHDAYSTRYVLCGLDAAESEHLAAALEHVGSASPERVAIFPGSVAELLAQARQEGNARPAGPAVRVGGRLIQISQLLERAVPVDREYVILTDEDIGPLRPEENLESIKADFMAGRGLPLRAIANNVPWTRPGSMFEQANDLGRRVSSSTGARVAVLDVLAEEGAGLTTGLYQLAMAAAKAGCPTLVCRPETRRVDYSVLEGWMEYLAPTANGLESTAPTTFYLVFDDYDGTFEATSGIADLTRQLKRSGRSVVLIRGVHGNASLGRPRDVEPGLHRVLPTTRASLTPSEQLSLQNWADRWWSGGAERLKRALVGWARAWDDGDRSIPLLVALYAILRGEVQSPTDVARAIIAQAEALLERARAIPPELSEDGELARRAKPLSRDELVAAVARLRTVRSGESSIEESQVPIGMEALRRTLLILCTFSTLRIGVDSNVLSELTDLSVATTRAALRILSDARLVDLRISTPQSAGMRGRQVLYSVGNRVGITHPTYARIIIEGATTGPPDSTTWLGQDSLVRELQTEMESAMQLLDEQPFGDYPIWILRPVLRRLRPSAAQVEFTREVAVRYLRLQRFAGSPFHEWLWPSTRHGSRRRECVLAVFSSIPEPVVRQSSVLLHSRAMTKYKLCERVKAVEKCRELYQSAMRDLTLALDVTKEEQGSGELQANLVTSLARLLMGWAENEAWWAQKGTGSLSEAVRLRELARRWYREGIALRRDNPYAAFGLAALLVGDCEELAKQGLANTGERFGADLTEALELLEGEPEPSFREEWEESKSRAIALLGGEAADGVINSLRKQGSELWGALAALKELGGKSPDAIVDERDAAPIRSALRLLEMARSLARQRSPIAAFLRFSLFSSLPERRSDPAFRQRLDFLLELQTTRYLERPAMIFEHAMLLAQVGEYRAAAEVFANLRRGKRFVEVPIDRAGLLCTTATPNQPMVIRMRIVGHRDEGLGWARIEDPRGFPDPVPFSLVDFRRIGGSVQVNTTRSGWVKLAPAGFFIVPQVTRRDGKA